MTAEIFLTSVWGPKSSVRLAKAAEEAGLRTVWLAEHHRTDYGLCRDALGLAASILDICPRLCVGTAVVPFTHHPELYALPASRFTLGVGRGSRDEATSNVDYEAGFADWLGSLAERMPVMVAAVGESTVRLAGSLGLPLLLGVENDDAAVEAKLAIWRSAPKSGGQPLGASPSHSDGQPLGALPRSGGQWREKSDGGHVRAVLPVSSKVDVRWLHEWQGRKMVDPRGHVARICAVRAGSVVPRKMVMVEAAGSVAAAQEVIASLSAVRTER